MHLLECNAHLRGKDGGCDDASFVVGWYCACCASRSALLRLRKLTINALNGQPPPDMPALAAWAILRERLKCLDS